MVHVRHATTSMLILALAACSGGGSSDPGTPGSSPSSGSPGSGSSGSGVPVIAGCSVFPADNPWNRDVSGDPVDARSDAYIASIGANRPLHPDFGRDPTYGIPWTTVPGSQPRVPMQFDYADESDPGPYPFPPDAPIEAGGDRHVLVLDRDNCRLYETFDSRYLNPGWRAGSPRFSMSSIRTWWCLAEDCRTCRASLPA